MTYGLTDSAYVRVTDQDRNLSSTALDTVSVRLSTPKEPLGEKITLTETGVSSGIFRGWLRFDATGAVAQDGFLQVTKGQKVTASYRDPADDFGNVSTVTGSSFYGLTVVPSGSLQVGSTTTWTQANSPYLLTGDILVPRTSTLVIQPGVEVRFKPVTDDLAGGEDPNRIEIRVEGRLDARGTATDSIRFISNGDVPASGDWYGIVLNYQYSMMGSTGNINGENRLHVRHSVFSHYTQGVVVKNGGFWVQNYRSEDSVVVRNARFVFGGSALSIVSADGRPIEFSHNKLVNCGVVDNGWSSIGYKSFRFNNVINKTTASLTFKVRLRTPYNYLGETYIQDNTFENTYLDMTGSNVDGPQRVWIQRNTMTKCSSYNTGMNFSINNSYSSGTADSVRYVITDNVIRGRKGNSNTGYGIYLTSNQNPISLQISNNILRSNQYGIYVQSEKSSKAKILNNVVDSSYYDGIRLTRVSGKLQGNTITNNGWSSSYWGVYLNSDFNYPGLDSLINNTISGNGNVSSPNSTTTSPTRGGVSINGHTTAVMNNNNFVANNSFDVVNQVAESVVAQQNAKFNYWGPVTTAAIALGANPKNLTRIYDKYDNATLGFVNYGQNMPAVIGNELQDTLYYGGDTITVATNTGVAGNWNNGAQNKSSVKLYNYSGKLKVNFVINGLNLKDSMYVYDLKRIYVSPTGSNANNGRQNKPKSTIQAAIKSADEGDTILVAPGTYSRFIIEGKRLNVFGLDSLNRPVISGYDTARAVEVESRGVVLKHLSLRNGNAPVTRNWNRGGLLYGGFDSLTVRSCDFKDGFASQGGDYYGGGGKVIFINCSFLKNTKNATALPNRGIFFVDNGLWMEMYNSVVDAEDFGSVFMNGFTHRIYNSTIVNLSGNLYTQPWTGHEFKLINSIVTKKAGKTISLTPNLANLWNGWGGPIELRKSRLPQVPTSYTYSSTASITVTACDTLPVYFTNAATGDYRLSNLDEHHNIGDATVRLYRDAKGMSRPDVNGKVDLGAFESNAETCALNRALVTLSKTIRANSQVTLKATGRNITSVAWNTGQTGSTINVYPNQTRWFKATLTDASGCTHVDSIKVDVANVTFRLDLRNQPTVVAGPHLAGTWNNWTANVDSLTQVGNTTIYQRTFGLVVGDTIQYKFINGATWSDPHDILPTSCGEGPYGNRKFIVGASATVLPVVHLSSCTQAKPVNPLPLNQPLKCIGVGQVLSAGPQLTNVVWNTGDTTNSITVKTPGTYWFTAKYPHKVVVLDTTVVTNVSSNAIGLGGVVSRYGVSIPVANPNTVALCPGNSVTLSNISTGTSYLWSSGATTSSVTVNSAGTHYSMVQRANGCWDTTSTVTITMNAAPDTAMTVTGPLAFCPGGSVTLTAAAGQTYLWSTGSLNQSVTLSQTSTPFAIVSTSNGCIDTTRTVSVTRFADPDTAVSVSGPLEFCPGGSVTLTAAAGQDYLWNTGDTTQSTTISLTGTAYALVTTINGCSDTTASFATTRFAAPDTNVLASDPLAFCPGFSVTLTAAAGLSYAWNNGDTAQFVTVSQSGSTFAIVTTSNGCSDTTATFVTTLHPGADTTITASKLTFCASDSSVITAAGGQSYLWNTGDTTQSITVNQTGNYSVTVTTVNGCVGVTDTVSTTVVPDVVLPQILGDLYGWFASGDTVNFSVANTGGYQLTWGIAGGQITAGQGSDTVEVIWGAADSTASIWVVVSNGVCQDSAYLNLVISGMGNVDQVNARAMAFPNPNTGVFTLEWSNIEAQQVVIYNGVGQVVGAQKVHEGGSSIQMDLRGNAAGIYRAVIYGKDGQVTLPVYVRY